MIILIRHAQSEGNKNREIHQTIPDHRVKLTPEGHRQAQEAGTRLRGLLRPDDTIHFFTSPYRRTRETTEGILSSLTADTPSPSPFPRQTIKVYEEPRLREQDFGNFQPCSAEMERMWLERSDYGHFFYRIPNGESAADAYDRVSGFNESMWRLFGEKDFASVCVLVTHGLMTRVFLMKWYHWSVEYFEDLRNINHCEFVIMKLNEDSGKYALQNQLRTWSELKREKELERQREHAEKGLEPPASAPSETPVPIRRKWGGCPDGCTHGMHRKTSLRSSRTHAGDQRKDQDTHHKSAHDSIRHNQTSQESNPSATENTVTEGQTLTAPEPAIGDRLGDEMPLKTLPSNTQYLSTPEKSTPPHNNTKHHHHHRHHLSPSHPKSPLFASRPKLPNCDSEDRLHAHATANYNLIHLVGRDGGGTLSGAPSVAASEDERERDSSNNREPTRGHLKRHKPRPSQDLDNDGDDEGSGRQTPKLRRTKSTHHRHGNAHTHPSNPNQSLNAATPRKTETIPDTDDTETDNAPLEHEQQSEVECKRDADGNNDDDALEQARKEDQSIRGSVY
ncbi:acid phosphatase DET1 [Aspergillus undulatus]|uniref:acid phosphatase DET1 n=1 Tax=Aspergillus undulatus TaxID=1810928 RepID=UPI003CCE13F8